MFTANEGTARNNHRRPDDLTNENAGNKGHRVFNPADMHLKFNHGGFQGGASPNPGGGQNNLNMRPFDQGSRGFGGQRPPSRSNNPFVEQHHQPEQSPEPALTTRELMEIMRMHMQTTTTTPRTTTTSPTRTGRQEMTQAVTKTRFILNQLADAMKTAREEK